MDQTCYLKINGPFTGEISPVALKEIGCDYVILGPLREDKFSMRQMII